MIEKIYDIDGAYELFKSYNGVGNENCIFYATYEKPITPAEVAASVLLVGALNAVGSTIIGVKPANSNYYPAYLINQTENGIGLIALEPASFTTQYPIDKMKIVPNSYVFIAQADIKEISIKKNPLCLNPSIRFVTIDTHDGARIKFRVSKKDKYITYQEENFSKFKNRYSA